MSKKRSFSDVDVLTRGRYAGLVQRYHAWPTHSKQSVAEHTWQMMRIYREIFGPIAPDVCDAMLWHDCGELSTGDVPLFAKRDSPALRVACHNAEVAGLTRLGAPQPELSPQEQWRTKMVDLLEGLEHCLMELSMGNALILPALTNYQNAIDRHQERAPAEQDLRPVITWLMHTTQHFNLLLATMHSAES